MVNLRIIYGYIIDIDDIEEIFNYDKYPDFWENGGEKLKDTLEVFDMAIKEISDKIKHQDIKIHYVDSEHISQFYNCPGIKLLGETMLLVGIELGRCDAHYYGVMGLPDVSNQVKSIMINNLDINLRVNNDIAVYCFVDAEL